ncbi:hypothetical protein DH2020_004254 [Rehmannia glutinosa]|uniref:General transcription factor 3C polypeptide 3 n=1 Tax=Rehmannia glutinosa TaxID=99300 RepID=A0ABR0XP89_REHGL
MAELGGATPTTDMNSSNSCSIPGERVIFDAVEHPLELELDSELGLQEDEQHEEDGDNSEVSEEEEAEYTFQFQGEMDPLSFAEEEDASGLHPYERFERIQHHYEVLAAKKRPAQQNSLSEMPAKRLRQEEILGASFEEIMETMNYGMRKKSRKTKKRGRRKGSKNKVNPEVTRKLGDATLHYAHGRFEEAICVLKEVIRLAPNLSDPYHTLALIYTAMSDKKGALNFYMIAAHLTPKDSSLWKLLVARSIEQGDKKQANYCLSKAIIADPEDIGVQFHRAALYVELGEYLKAADSYEQISCLCPNNIELYKKCGQCERAVCMLEDSLRNHVNVANLSVVDLLASVLMETNAYARALEHIDRTQQVYGTGNENPLHLIIKAGICHVHLGHLEKAEAYFNVLKPENASTHPHLIIDVADSLTTVGHYESALKYYMMLEEDMEKYNVRNAKYTAETAEKLGDSVDARLTLSSLLLEENRDDEAISVLSPPVESGIHALVELLEMSFCCSNFLNICCLLSSESNLDTKPDAGKLWWRSGKIKLKLSQIYKAKGSFEAFVDALFPVIRETLFLETVKEKVKVCRRLSISVLSQRVKVLDDHQTDSVFHGFRFCMVDSFIAKEQAFLAPNYKMLRNLRHFTTLRGHIITSVWFLLAATHYEKVLAICEKDYPIPILPNDNPDLMDSKKPGYCDLREKQLTICS